MMGCGLVVVRPRVFDPTIIGKLVCILALVLRCVLCTSEHPELGDRARLVVTKEVLNRYLVEAKEVTLLYTIHNLSPRAARDVEIHDRLPESDFSFVHGSRSTRWPVILPMSNITHSVIVIPRSAGYFNFTSAEVTYKAGPDGTVTYGYSSAPGMRLILTPSVFNRQFSSHWVGLSYRYLTSLDGVDMLCIHHGTLPGNALHALAR
ncbi:unnamed protein product [Hydatigera taeniaeformis]|uniref:Translocon-associated protein subunit beta n=1 Tax=Hydatigena taeniaeformis TaxID=6205 RepID=A0A0R3WRY0_HYDTA|nr:unnamed protein product [Hydatigera taeniaeformis]